MFVGCASEVVVDVDADQDGLLGSEEAALGTDPNAADSDGDGVDDGVELANNTDPLNGGEYPYKGGWAIDSCHDDIKGEGLEEGAVADDFALTDQNGQSVHLYSFCNRVVYMVFAAFW
jgi:hypothetical protein